MTRKTSGEEAQRRRDLYDAGMGDTEMANTLGTTQSTVSRWRKRAGLPPNCKQGQSGDFLTRKAVEANRLALYKAGWNDYEIARALGVNRQGIFHWRAVHGLPGNCRRGGAVTKTDALRRTCHRQGMSDQQIGKRVGATASAIGKWRLRVGLPPNHSDKPVQAFQWPKTADGQLMQRIVSAVGFRAPPNVTSEAVSELALAITLRAIRVEDIERKARAFLRAAWNSEIPHATRSLDAPTGDDNFCMLERIRDERSSAWLEEMGATVF